jgi:DNA-binding Lrp family transcriptional regulator
MQTKPCAELPKLKNVHNILYEIIKNSGISVKEIASKVKLKEHQVRYIIKKLRKSNMGRYYIKVNMEKLYPIEFLLVSPEIIKLPEEVLVKNLFLASNKALLHGFTENIKNLYGLVKRFSTDETMIIVEKLIENFLFMEEYI